MWWSMVYFKHCQFILWPLGGVSTYVWLQTLGKITTLLKALSEQSPKDGTMDLQEKEILMICCIIMTVHNTIFYYYMWYVYYSLPIT